MTDHWKSEGSGFIHRKRDEVVHHMEELRGVDVEIVQKGHGSEVPALAETVFTHFNLYCIREGDGS